MASCQKNNNLTQKQELCSDDQKIEQQIIQFKNQLSDTKKSGEIVELDSAIWYINFTLNYTYTFPYIEYCDYYIDSAFVTMNIYDDVVTFIELGKTYCDIEDVLREHFFSIENTNKHIVNIFMEETDICENNTIEFKIVSEVGVYNTEKSTNVSNTDNPFGSTDWWSMGSGKCGIYSDYAGWDAEWDAAKKISKAVNTKLANHSFAYYFTDDTFFNLLPWTTSSIPNGLEYYLCPESCCLSSQNMNCYYHRMLELFDYYKPSGKSFHYVTIYASWDVGIKGDPFFDVNVLLYGIKHKRETAPVNPCLK
ncbi:MAG: hypothetical protein IMY72_14510 [Bacteroidetes bacterium]|nr:hypothetical protein [Bacteroidota bacterium]